jgi:hypothetical protein
MGSPLDFSRFTRDTRTVAQRPQQTNGIFKTLAPPIIRGVSGFVPKAAWIGGPWTGVPIGGIMGAGGEALAQLAEGRPDINWKSVGAMGALGAVPIPGSTTIGKAALKSAGMSGLGEGLYQQTEGWDQYGGAHAPTIEELGGIAFASGVGGAIGGGLHWGLDKWGKKVPVAPPVEPSESTALVRSNRPRPREPIIPPPPPGSVPPTSPRYARQPNYARQSPLDRTTPPGEPPVVQLPREEGIKVDITGPQVISPGVEPPVVGTPKYQLSREAIESPFKGTYIGNLIKDVPLTNNQELNAKLLRMKEIADLDRLDENLLEEFRTLGYTVSRDPNMPAEFRRQWSQGSSLSPKGVGKKPPFDVGIGTKLEDVQKLVETGHIYNNQNNISKAIESWTKALESYKFLGMDNEAEKLRGMISELDRLPKVTADELMPEVKTPDDFLARIEGYWKEFETDLDKNKLTLEDYVNQKRDLIRVLKDNNYIKEASKFEDLLDKETRGILARISTPEKPQAMKGSNKPNIEIEQIPNSKNWGIYLNGQLHEGFFSREAALRGAENLKRELDPTYKTPQDLQWEEDIKSMSNTELRRRYELLANREDYENPDITSAMKAIELEIDRRQRTPERMKVPGVIGPSGLPNVAMGGASERVLDVLGSSLYSGSRAKVTAKELFQNSKDEQIFSGSTSPIRVAFIVTDKHPITGADAKSISVADRGRGLQPEMIYKELSDVGETGKAGYEEASGGFGFAKAAPFLGGDYTRVISTVIDPNTGKKMRYTFEGTPAQLKNQAKGVPLIGTEIDPNSPTGLAVTTWFPRDTYLHPAENYINKMVKRSGSLPFGIMKADVYSQRQRDALEDFLVNDDPMNTLRRNADIVMPEEMPPLKGSIDLPNIKVDFHFEDPEIGTERGSYTLDVLNKGLYQMGESGGYGMTPLPDVPKEIVANIISKVKPGEAGYPFTANREQLDDTVKEKIDEWISENVVKIGERNRIAKIQKDYDNIAPNIYLPHAFLDAGRKYSAVELKELADSPEFNNAFNSIQKMHKEVLDIADTLGWEPQYYGSQLTDWKPSARLQKVGILFEDRTMNNDGTTTLGIHIPNPSNLDNSAILYNFFELLKDAGNSRDPLDRLSTGIYTVISHEVSHIPGGGHDTGHSYRHARLLRELGQRWTTSGLEEIANAFKDPTTGGINTRLLELLSKYNESRLRDASTADDILRTGIHSKRQADIGGGKGSNVRGDEQSRTTTGPTVNLGGGSKPPGGKPPKVTLGGSGTPPGNNLPPIVIDPARGQGKYVGLRPDDQGFIRKSLAFARELQTSLDLSFPFRQGISHIRRKEFWQAFHPMFTSLKSDADYHRVMGEIEKNRWYETAHKYGVDFTDLSDDISKREEQFRSKWAEELPYLGKYVTKSARAYHVFGNKLRMDVFASMMDNARKAGIDVSGSTKQSEKNIRGIASLINDSTGRGRLPSATYGGKVADMEAVAPILNDFLFSPKFIMSRINMFRRAFGGLLAEGLEKSGYTRDGKKVTYSGIMDKGMDPRMAKQLRREALKSMGAIGGLALVSGGISSKLFGKDEAMDPRSTDFGKLKIGDTRLDFTGGFQQYVRLATQMHTAMANVDGQLEARDPLDTGNRFLRNKFSPIAALIADWYAGENVVGEEFKFLPESLKDRGRLVEMLTPLIVGDMIELYNEDNKMTIPGTAAATFGVGVSSYGETAGEQRPSQRRRNQGAPPVSAPRFRTPEVYIPGR